MTFPPQPALDFIDRRRHAIAGVLLFLIAAIHIGSLNRHSLANNEFITLRVIRKPTAREVIVDRVTNNHSPGYFLLVRAWTQVFGQGQVSMRFPSAIFSLIGIVVIWRLGAYLFGRRLGLLALAFSGFCQAPLQLSADTRMYSMLFCALALTLWSAIRFLEASQSVSPSGSLRWGALLVLAGFLGLGAQFLYLFGPILLTAWCACHWRAFDRRRLWLLLLAWLPVLLFLPWLLWWRQVQYKVGVYRYPHWISITGLLKNLTTLFLGDPHFFREDSTLGEWHVLLIAAGFVLTMFAGRFARLRPAAAAAAARYPLGSRYLGLLWLWALGPWLLIAAAATKSDDNLIKLWRYYAMIAAAAPLLLAAMVAGLNGAGRPVWAAALGAYLMFVILTTSTQFIRSDGSGLREVARHIQPRLRQGDLVLASMTRRRSDAFPYYGMTVKPLEVPFNMTDLDYVPPGATKPIDRLEPILPWLQSHSAGHKRLWAIFYNSKYKNDLLYKAIKSAPDQFVPLERKVYAGGDTSVGLYEIKVSAATAPTTETAPVARDLP